MSDDQEQNVQKIVVVQAAGKSMAVAIILAILFGSLGMMYATVMGGVVMLVISLLAAIFTLGVGLFIMWPIGVIRAAVATNTHNKKALAA